MKFIIVSFLRKDLIGMWLIMWFKKLVYDKWKLNYCFSLTNYHEISV